MVSTPGESIPEDPQLNEPTDPYAGHRWDDPYADTPHIYSPEGYIRDAIRFDTRALGQPGTLGHYGHPEYYVHEDGSIPVSKEEDLAHPLSGFWDADKVAARAASEKAYTPPTDPEYLAFKALQHTKQRLLNEGMGADEPAERSRRGIARYFDRSALLGLDEQTKRAITDAVHELKDRMGVHKLDPEDMKRVAAQVRARALHHYLGGDYSEELAGRIESARLKTIREERSKSQIQKPASAQSSKSQWSGEQKEKHKTAGRAGDNWELSLMYLAGKLNKDGKQPPSMSSESLASAYVRYFKLDRPFLDQGLSETDALKSAKAGVMDTAMRNFAQLQSMGFIDADYIKIDPSNPSHDTRVTGHRVIADKPKLEAELELYRKLRAEREQV